MLVLRALHETSIRSFRFTCFHEKSEIAHRNAPKLIAKVDLLELTLSHIYDKLVTCDSDWRVYMGIIGIEHGFECSGDAKIQRHRAGLLLYILVTRVSGLAESVVNADSVLQ